MCVYVLYEAILTYSDPESNSVLQTECHFHAKVKKIIFKKLNAIVKPPQPLTLNVRHLKVLTRRKQLWL